MNKNTKKNRTPKAPANHGSIALTVILAVAVVIATGLAVFTAIKAFAPETAPVVPTDVNPAGNDVQDMAKYLKEKYGKDFVYTDTTQGASLFYADGLNGLVAVMRREIAQEFYDGQTSLFTDKYADNGYTIINADKAAEYYRPFISVDLGNSRLLTYSDIIVDPSSATPNTEYATYLKITHDLTIPQLIILTDKTLSQDELKQLEDDMIKMGTPVTMRVFTLDAEAQKTMIPTHILSQGASDSVQYLRTLNADHMKK